MAEHVYFIPDCKNCGAEMRRFSAYRKGTQTKENPFGEKFSWWECPECGTKEEIKKEGE